MSPPAAPARAAATSLVRLQELELDHLLVAHLAVQVVAGELQVLVEALRATISAASARSSRVAPCLPARSCQARARARARPRSRRTDCSSERVTALPSANQRTIGRRGPGRPRRRCPTSLPTSGKRPSKTFLTAWPDEPPRHHLGALLLALVDHLDLAGDGRQQHLEVAEARVDRIVAGGQGAALQVRDQQLHGRDGHAGARRPRTGPRGRSRGPRS